MPHLLGPKRILKRALAAQVVSTGLERCSKHLQTAVVLVLSTDSASQDTTGTSAGLAGEGTRGELRPSHGFTEVVIYSNAHPPPQPSSANPSGT